jgi:hypothetical protein
VLARGGVPFAVVVVVNAAVQALLVAFDPHQPLSLASLLIAAASGVLLLAAVAALWLVAERAAGLRRPVAGALLRTLAAGVVTGAVSVVLPPLVPLVVAAGCALLAAVGVRASGAVAARHPLAFTGLSVATVLVVAAAWVLDLLLGLFVTGPAAAATSWLVVGASGTLLVCHWIALTVRPTRRPRTPAEPAL